MEFINDVLVGIDEEPMERHIFDQVFGKMWESVVNIDQLNEEFDQELASVLLTIDTNADINQLTKDVVKIVRDPFNSHELNVENGRLYLDSIPDQETWNALYEKFINVIPFTPIGRRVFGKTGNLLYDMYHIEWDEKDNLKELVINYWTKEFLPLYQKDILATLSKSTGVDEQQIV